MKLVIVSGPEATCKTTIGKYIAGELGFEYLSKDSIKEAMYNTDDHNTWDFNWYESRAKNKFFEELKALVSDNKDIVIESNFMGSDKDKLRVITNSQTEIFEIHCNSNGLKSFQRFIRRNENKERHPGHHDRRWYLKVFYESIMHNMGINIKAHRTTGLTSKILQVNTSNFGDINYKSIINFIS